MLNNLPDVIMPQRWHTIWQAGGHGACFLRRKGEGHPACSIVWTGGFNATFDRPAEDAMSASVNLILPREYGIC